jgi:hypothetical protein
MIPGIYLAVLSVGSLMLITGVAGYSFSLGVELKGLQGVDCGECL